MFRVISHETVRHAPITIRNYTYSPNDFLGAGNFSKVYAGINLNNNERVAIKIVDLYSLDT